METGKGTSVAICVLLFQNSQFHMILTDLRAFTQYIKSKEIYVVQLRDIVSEYFSSKPKRFKRGIWSLEDVLKFLFGTVT